MQVDHKKGFGGKFGVESDRVDKAAAGYGDAGGQPVGTAYQRTRPEASSQGAKNLKSRFEDMAKSAEEDDRRRAEEERQKRQAREEKEKSAEKVPESSYLYEEAAPARPSVPAAAAPPDEDEFYQDAARPTVPAAAPTPYEDVELYQDTTQASMGAPAAEVQFEDEELYQDAGADRDADKELYQDTTPAAQQQAYDDEELYQV